MYGHMITKISQVDQSPNFLTCRSGAPLKRIITYLFTFHCSKRSVNCILPGYIYCIVILYSLLTEKPTPVDDSSSDEEPLAKKTKKQAPTVSSGMQVSKTGSSLRFQVAG